jgi:hypothetical protein
MDETTRGLLSGLSRLIVAGFNMPSSADLSPRPLTRSPVSVAITSSARRGWRSAACRLQARVRQRAAPLCCASSPSAISSWAVFHPPAARCG